MKKLLIAGAALTALIGTQALAADMALKAPPPAPAPAWSWTGFYVGLNAGYGVANDPFNQVLSEPGFAATSSIDSRVTPNGGLFGGQAGYNYQAGNIVVGVEGDIQWSGEHDTAGCGFQCVSEAGEVLTEGSAEQRIKWFGTARGRIGWTNNDWLLYVTGGGAWGGINATTAFNLSGTLVTGAFSNTTSFTKGGGVIGGGTEVHLGGQWTAKFEYLYMDLGSISDMLAVPAPLGPFTLTTNSKIHDNIVRAGLNFKIDSAPAALAGTPVLAADMAAPVYKAPPRPAPPAWSWTGFYVGLNAGYGVANDPFNQVLSGPGFAPNSSSIDSRVTPKGGLFGGQAGYNYQAGNIVVGVEGDIQWSGEHDTAGCGLDCIADSGVVVATLGSTEQKINWFGTARGRIGYTNNDWLLYITGGGAWGEINATTAAFNLAGTPPLAASETTSFTKGGGVIGGGTEVHLGGQWTAKFEYLYMDLGSISDTLVANGIAGGAVPAALTTNSKIHDNIVRAGLNFKIN